MIYLIIYLIGFIVTYWFCKKIREKIDCNDWKDVFTTIFSSFKRRKANKTINIKYKTK